MTKNKLVSLISGAAFMVLYGTFPYFIVPTLVIAVTLAIGVILYGLMDKFDEPSDETSYYICISPNSLIGPILAGNLINLYSPARAYSITSNMLFIAFLCSTAISPVADSNGTFKRQELFTIKFMGIARLVLVLIFLVSLSFDIYSLISSART